MSDPIATYSFLPWLRQGLAGRITAADGDAGVKLRATIPVSLELSGERLEGGTATETITRDVALYGPGDVIGIDPRAIVRTEPRHWTTNFEPGYLAHVEFYDETFPWRYTPAAPNGHRLRPWIMLLVLEDGEFVDAPGVPGRRLPSITVTNPQAFPPADQLWAWAHVHVNRSLAARDDEFVSTDRDAVLPKLAAALAANPDLACSRLVSPRRLAPDRAYHAFVMPVFETGRLAGLGEDPAGSPNATASAWEPPGKVQVHPYYHRWYFRTGADGDFETLVRLLKPQPADRRVGLRDMDVQAPGPPLPGIAEPALRGVLKLGGALRVPRASYSADELAVLDAYDGWATPYPHQFQTALAAFLNLADDYAAWGAEAAHAASGLPVAVLAGPDEDRDPLVVPPIYGVWHAAVEPPPAVAARPLTGRLLVDRAGALLPFAQNWLHELNLDPRFRVPAGFGARVVQKEQEAYMDAAWEQVGRILEANRRIRLGELAQATAWSWHDRHLAGLQAASPERLLGLAAPLSKRILIDGRTLYHRMAGSRVQPALTAAVTRRALAPRRRLSRVTAFTGEATAANLLERVEAGAVAAAPPPSAPSGAITTGQIADTLTPAAPSAVVAVLRAAPRLLWAGLAAGILLALVLIWLAAPAPLAVVLTAALLAAAAWLIRRLAEIAAAVAGADLLREENQTPGAVDALPASPGFSTTAPAGGAPPGPGSDSSEAVRFKAALKDAFAAVAASAAVGRPPVLEELDFAVIGRAILAATDPDRTVPRQVWHDVQLPARLRAETGEAFREVMAYPEFDTPMYKPLAALSAELFLPNINFIAQNSLTLLETNRRFIEAYMVGLNHEFARELLWREYPTDQRGSYFRQFWDVAGVLGEPGLDEAERRERLRDITPLHRWPRASSLGRHDGRKPAGAEEDLVLVIRGELLKRYPTAVIYMHRARWSLDKNGRPDPKRERQLVELSAAEVASPPRTTVRMPLYDAKVDPDIYFFGFDLTVEAAIGGDGSDPRDDPGWFFVIKERPSESRFGLDSGPVSPLNVWNDLAWAHLPGVAAGGFIEITGATATLALKEPTGPELAEKREQWADDVKVAWGKDASSADLAYILFQAPVMMAVHAAEMLTRK